MSSPPGDGPVLSSSPTSMRGVSPVRRRESEIDVYDPTRPRLSPALARTFDPNDPEVRERQRTMDVDMAMQLSRARRETISTSPGVSPYEISSAHPHADPNFPSLSLSEQHDLDIARGDRPHPVDHDEIENTLHMH